jgi:hypothetical protein
MNQAFTVVQHTTQVTQIVSFYEPQAKTILKINCDHLGPTMAIVLSIHALHLL